MYNILILHTILATPTNIKKSVQIIKKNNKNTASNCA